MPSLVIEAQLHDQNGTLIVDGKTFFPACRDGKYKNIVDEHVQVEVEWTYPRGG